MYDDADEKEIEFGYYSSAVDDNVILSFTYSDRFFAGTSSSFSDQIALTSISLATAAYSKGVSNDLLRQLGFSDIKQENYEREATPADCDYVAYTIAKKEIQINNKAKNLVVVLVRGTPASYEWYSNFNVGQEGTHKGFSTAAEEIEIDLSPYLTNRDADDNILWITGHSRGAAVANILAGTFSTNYPENIKREHVYGYTFACPAVSIYADTTLDNIFNFCNPGDVVTRVPLSEWGYKRNGIDIKISHADHVKKKFKELTGRKYKGFKSAASFVKQFEKWVPDVDELYEEKNVKRIGYSRTMTKHQVLLAIATFLVKGVRQSAIDLTWEDIEDAILGKNMSLPVGVVTAYLSTEIANNGVGFFINYDEGKTAIGDGIAHSHCQELYYAWVSTMQNGR